LEGSDKAIKWHLFPCFRVSVIVLSESQCQKVHGHIVRALGWKKPRVAGKCCKSNDKMQLIVWKQPADRWYVGSDFLKVFFGTVDEKERNDLNISKIDFKAVQKERHQSCSQITRQNINEYFPQNQSRSSQSNISHLKGGVIWCKWIKNKHKQIEIKGKVKSKKQIKHNEVNCNSNSQHHQLQQQDYLQWKPHSECGFIEC
jgi:hypothetical protein